MGSDHSKGPGFGTGLALGALMGSLVALLLAPRPGEETRTQVMEKTAPLREKAEVLANEARERLKEAIEEGRIVASRIMAGHDDNSQKDGALEDQDNP